MMFYEVEGYETRLILVAPVVPDVTGVTEVKLYNIVQIVEPYAIEI
jgi:hypothetical protein